MPISPPLGPRSACAVRDCRHACVAFVAANPDGSPKYSDFDSQHVTCFVCNHTWMAHAQPFDIPPQHRAFVRGGTADGRCGGFFSPETHWNMLTTCVCGLQWGVHARDTHASLISSANVSPPVSTPPPVVQVTAAAAAPAPLVPQRPVTAFTGLRPSAASVQQQRRLSIQRNLHSNQPTGSTSLVPTPPRKPKKRMAGPPRSYSESPASTSILDDFAPLAVDTPVTSAKITVGILPKVLDTSDHNDTLDLSPRYIWKNGNELERVQSHLNRANLVFTVEVSTTGPVFEEINTAFENHCRLNNIDYVPPPASGANDTPNTKAWVLTGPKGRSTARTWVEDPKLLTRFTFTLQALGALPFSYTPNNIGEGLFIFIAPRFRNIYAPIDSLFDPNARLPDHVRPHKCFGRRVLHPIVSSLSGDPHPVCGPSCTQINSTPSFDISRPLPDDIYSDSGDEFPEMDEIIDEITLGQSGTSSTSTIVTRSVRRQQWQEEAAAAAIPVSVTNPGFSTKPFTPCPLLTTAMEVTPTSIKSRSFLGVGAPLDLTLRHMPGAGTFSFSAWQDYILLPHERGEDHIHIISQSIDEGARALVTLCLWIFAGRPTGLKLKEVIQEQFSSPRPTVEGSIHRAPALLSLRVTIGNGIGAGPRNEVVAQAVQIMMSDGHYWTERGDYQTLRLHPSRDPIPARSCLLKATGFIFLLHFLYIGAPIQASPFLFSTLFNGRKSASKFDVEFLSRFLSPDSLSLIQNFESVPLDEPLYTSQSEECIAYQYLLNIPDVDPTLISTRRSREEHEGICGTIISFVTLGSVDIEHQPDFLALGDGFNLVLEPFIGQDRAHHILEWFETPCREFLLLAYDRRIKEVADVLTHLEFSQTNPENDVWGDNDETVELIKRFMTHYLTERGHPTDPDQVISALTGDDGTTDPLLRANLFLSVVTGSSHLPLRPTWQVKCLITHDWSEDYPTTDADGRDDYGPDVKVSFRSCFKTFSITNNARLRQLLLRTSSLTQGSTNDHFGTDPNVPVDPGSEIETNPLANWPDSLLGETSVAHQDIFGGRALDAHTAAIFSMMGHSDQNSSTDTFPSSPSESFPLSTISPTQFNSFPPPVAPSTALFQSFTNSGLHVHSPQAVHASPSRSGSLSAAGSSSFGFSLAFDRNSGFAGFDHQSSSSTPSSAPITPAADGFHPFQANVVPPRVEDAPLIIADNGLRGILSPPPQRNPGRGSLDYLRARIVTPAPPSDSAAVYIGFPNHGQPTRRTFFEPRVPVSSPTPYLMDLIRSLRSLASPAGTILNDICASLSVAGFNVAWSKTMVEVHDVTYTSVTTGYREVGNLRDQLRGSRVVLSPANHNETSTSTFQNYDVPLEMPFFVLYVFPQEPVPSSIIPAQLGRFAPIELNSRSRSNTPAPGMTQPPFLFSLLRITKALDERYTPDGDELHSLLEARYGTAYLQIRQALIIERVFTRAKTHVAKLTIDDVAAWAGLKPKTYGNNRTFAISARATLQCLRARLNSPEASAQSRDNRQKDSNLKDFLGKCFSPDLLTGDWQSADASAGDLTVGGAAVVDVKERIRPFENLARPFKNQLFVPLDN
ncbi:hypothetical protein B0H11DRAFT_2300484 [Mycena galericulata]|nr:hypothetical protein B0H11DRAFT_2300484 [Mycena galericulata]